MKLYPRRLYIRLSLFFVSVLYFLRMVTIYYEPESFQFIKQFGYPTLNMDFLPWILLFILFLFFIALLIPKEIELNVSDKFRFFFQSVFYAEFLLLIIIIIIGVKAGENQSILEKAIVFFVYSVIPYNLSYFVLVLTGGKNKLNTLLYFAPSILMASKSGIIFALLLVITAKILKRERVFSFTIFISILISICLYPLMLALAIYHRVGGGNVYEVIARNFSAMGDNVIKVYEFVFISISRRVSGVDVLFIPDSIDNIVFSPVSIIGYLFKGISNAGLVDTLLGQRSFGIGRQFAIEFFGQNTDLANGFEPTLFGIMFHSSNPLLVSAIILLSVCCLFLFFRSRKDALGKVMLCYLIFVFCFVLMTGSIIQLSQTIKFYLLSSFIYYMYIRVFYKSGSKDKLS
ncbi:hypothetical protein GJ207_05270 [Vibrio parahaemolyticus]|nr:hypothetical protein [Vibrio parahaemolyticus]